MHSVTNSRRRHRTRRIASLASAIVGTTLIVASVVAASRLSGQPVGQDLRVVGALSGSTITSPTTSPGPQPFAGLQGYSSRTRSRQYGNRWHRSSSVSDQSPSTPTSTSPSTTPTSTSPTTPTSPSTPTSTSPSTPTSTSPSTSSSGGGATQASGCTPAPADTMTNTVSHLCGFPDTTNTGVPAGTNLTNVPGQETSGPGWTYDDNDGLVVTGNGTVINGLNIDNGIEIKASNVVIENSIIVETGDWWGIGLYNSNNVTIKHCDISSPDATGGNRLEVGIKDIYGNTVGTQIIDNNIWHAATAIQVANGVFEGNYIHDFGYNSADGDHINGVSVGGGDTLSLLVQGNTILDNYDQTDAIALFQDFGPEANKTINDNLLAGGSYSLYGGGPNGCTGPATAPKCDPSSNIVVTNNVFSTMFFSDGGTFGPVANFNSQGSGNVWQHNVWDGTNTAISP